MYLKQLELCGFKTFADRTTLEFGPGITAIVGPNGSGKSNICDAILWVLGEQAMKSLRSARAVDVIFNGSDARKALGFAEVHLTLDNSSHTLPTDFTEVTITRRVFRSGDSEYLINRTPVRLRDVQDLFLDTGIGKQSYSIINQGEVDAVLSSRSEDRRALFEEAAGINKYKHRKKEALRKLEQTRANLLRVHDIISELDGQLGPLAEQSEKARQYQAVSAELTDLQLALLVAQYQGLRSSLARAKEREAEIEQELEALRHALRQVEVRETVQRAELQTLEDELEERRGVEARFAGAIGRAEQALALLHQQETTARKEIERLATERADLEGQSGRFAEEIAAARAEATRLHDRAAEAQRALEATEGELRQATQAVGEMAQRIQQRRGDYLDVLDRMARARNEIARVESLLRTAEGRSARLAEEQAGVADRLAASREALATQQATLTDCRAARERITTRRGEVARAWQAAVDAQSRLQRDEARAREELAGVRARRHALQELEESLEGYFPGVRAVMSAGEKLAGWYAPVSELLTVPAELETAIEIALGASVQDIVTDTEAAARAAIALLKATGAGRATFLPLDLIAPAPRVQSRPDDGILGTAMDLVGYEARFVRVAQHLLGRVVIARDLDAALRLARDGAFTGWNRIVTLEGDVVHPSRAITGGTTGKASGLLKRKRELQELTAEMARREEQAERLQAQCRAASAEVSRLDGELSTLGKESERAAAAIAEAERHVATAQRDIAALADRHDALAAETAWIATEIAESRAAEATHLQALNALELEGRAAEAAVADAERTLAGGQSERDAIGERIATLRAHLAEARSAGQAQQAVAERAIGLRDTLAARLDDHARAAEALHAQLEGLAAQEREASDELLRLRDAAARAGGELDAAKARRGALLETVAGNLDEQKAARERIEECQGRAHRAALRTTQVETELGFLDGQFFEDYRLTADQAVARATPVDNRGVAAARLRELQAQVEALGVVNLGAIEEFDRVRERLEFLTTQRRDLEEGRDSLAKVIAEIDATCRDKFLEALATIGREFQELFVRLFGGGKTALSLTDPSDVLDSGIDIHVTIPGKHNQNLLQLSGGERALTALALLFAMLRVKPSPFVVLDEIDAPLDEANIGRYCEVLRDFTRDTQFLTITHNKGTMEAADVLYGVTMEKAGVSTIVSVRLTEAQGAAAG